MRRLAAILEFDWHRPSSQPLARLRPLPKSGEGTLAPLSRFPYHEVAGRRRRERCVQARGGEGRFNLTTRPICLCLASF